MRPALGLTLLVALTLPAFAGAQDPAPEVVAEGGGRIVVSLQRLGDADGDGRDDLLRIDTRLPDPNVEDDVQQVTATAISGSDLKKVLWTHAAPKGSSLAAWPDSNGDGVNELLEGAFTFTGSGTGLDAVVVSRSESSFTTLQDLRLLSGRDASQLTTIQAEGGSIFIDTFSGELYGSESTSNSTTFAVAGPGVIVKAFTSRVRQSYTTFLPGPVDAGFTRTDVDARVTYQPHAGQATAAAYIASDRLASAPILADVDGDGTFEAILLDSLTRQTYDVAGLQTDTYDPSVIAVGRDGTLIWRSDFPQVQGDLLTPALAGDLDGDGNDDIAFTVRAVQVTGDSTYTTRILSGADGQVLSVVSGETSISPRPLGDIDGDGKEETLVYRFAAGVSEAYVAGADLQPRWSLPLDEALVLNADGVGRRLTDWTGDGNPDVAHAREYDGGATFRFVDSADGFEVVYEFDPIQMKLDVLGADGKAAWTRELSGLLAFADVADLDGRGGADLGVLHLEGPASSIKKGDLRSSNITLEVIAGEDGTTLLQHTLRDGNNPITRDGMPSISFAALGDLDGRGGSEFGIGLRERSEDDEAAMEESVVQDWIVFSMSSGRAIAQIEASKPSAPGADGSIPGTSGGLAVAPDLVPVGGGSNGGKGAPVPAPVAMVAVAAAFALALGRRR